MAWNIKYYTEFKNDNNDLIRLDIEEEDYAGSITELKSGSNPIELISDEGDYMIPIVGTGMDINLISETPLQLTDLYSINKFGYKVKLYNNAILIWEGWLVSETYGETYSEYKNYVVRFSASDGISLLNNIPYTDGSGDLYRGIDSAFNIISNIISKIGLTSTDLHIADTLIMVDQSYANITHTATETYLHDIMIDLDNYIDELSEAMSCRKVMDAILKSLGLILRNNVLSVSSSSNITVGYTIFDNNVVYGLPDNPNMKVYNYQGTYISTWVLGLNDYKYDLQNDLEYTNTGSNMMYSDPINNQKLIYSKYTIGELFDIKLDPGDFCGFEACANFNGQTEMSISGCGANRWSTWRYNSIPGYTMIASTCYPMQEVLGVQGVTSDVYTGKDYYIQWPNTATSITKDYVFRTDIDTEYIFKNANINDNSYKDIAVLIDFEIMLQKKVCYDDAPLEITNYSMEVIVKVGSYEKTVTVFIGKNGATIQSDTYYNTTTQVGSPDDDGKGTLVVLGAVTDVALLGPVSVYFSRYHGHPKTSGGNFRVKNVSAKIVLDTTVNPPAYTYDDSSSETDIAHSAVINSLARGDGEDVELLHGINTTKFIDRGQLMYKHPTITDVYYNILLVKKGVEQGGTPIVLSSEQWLFNKIFSNHYGPMVKLSNISVKSSGVEHANLAKITDVAQFPDKLFMITGFNYRPYDNTIVYSLVEIEDDYLTLA